jgi:hypothetical protein
MEDLTRRTVIRGAATIAAAVPMLGLVETDLAFGATALTRSTFLPRKGTAFTVQDSARRTISKLKLAAVQDLDKRSPGSQTRFSLTFTVLSGRRPASGTYRFTHPAIGVFSMFITPVGRAGEIQAVFNAR